VTRGKGQDGPNHASSKILKDIRDYNKIDCDSTELLTKWLREQQQTAGIKYLAKPQREEEANSTTASRPSAILANQMLAEINSAASLPDDTRQLKELLAHLLEFHHRENKSVWWAMFDRHAMTEQELIDDLDCLGGLKKSPQASTPIKRSRLVHYTFDPAQDTKLCAGKKCYFAHDLKLGTTIETIDSNAGTTSLKFGTKISGEPEQLSLIPDEFVSPKALEDSIYDQVAVWNGGGSLSGAIQDLLLRRRPNLKGNSGGAILDGTGQHIEQVIRAVKSMDGTILCFQGPPGTGKTFTAAHVIAALVENGAKVGVSSNGHIAIAHLLDKAAVRIIERGLRSGIAKVQSKTEDFHATHARVQAAPDIASALASSSLIGGTAWAFSNPASKNSIDYLFIDEAGQVPLANILAMAASTKNIILMGDQMQLSQPSKGAHPGESGLSCLDYLLQDKQTISDDFGIFLGTSHRMHPQVCQFISDSFYEGRLLSHEITKSRVIEVAPAAQNIICKQAGIIFHAVEHEGNSQHSEEEIDAIDSILQALFECSLTTSGKLDSRRIILADVLIVAPYNMQVRALQAKFSNAKVGTVDKFQGQEAPVVIVSMSASDAADSPRGLEFLLSKNRMNVAISRAQTLAIVVASPLLAATQCNTLEQLNLVNTLCRVRAFDHTKFKSLSRKIK